MSTLKTMYDFKMYIPMNGANLLTFRAWVVDKDTYYLQEVPNFKINENDKNIFLSILDGSLNVNEYQIQDRQVNTYERILAQHDDISSKFSTASQFLDEYYGIITTFQPITLKNMVRFRYDGPELNVAYGLEPHSAGKIYHISDELIKTIATNNTTFKGIRQVSAQEGSTVIPYISEIIDQGAIDILKRAMLDIKHSRVDIEFSESSDSYSGLYKNFIRKLGSIKSIPGIKSFELLVGDEVEGITISDIGLISDANSGFYNRAISRVGVVHTPAYSLIGSSNIYSASVIIDGKEFKIHLKSEHENFEHMKRILQENFEGMVEIHGFTKSEATIEATDIRRFHVEP